MTESNFIDLSLEQKKLYRIVEREYKKAEMKRLIRFFRFSICQYCHNHHFNEDTLDIVNNEMNEFMSLMILYICSEEGLLEEKDIYKYLEYEKKDGEVS